MRTATFFVLVYVLLCASPASAIIQFDLSTPPPELGPGQAFSLNVMVVPSPEVETMTGASMRLKASSIGVLTLLNVVSGPGDPHVLIIPPSLPDPLDPYSDWFGWTPSMLPWPPQPLITLTLAVDAGAPAGLYTLQLTDIMVADMEFNEVPALGDEVTIRITPEPATLSLLLLGLLASRRFRRSRAPR